MFFCDSCATRNGWPQSLFASYGKYEECGGIRECSDVPSKYLNFDRSRDVKGA